jgi:AraC-like DNA-binding protein
MMRDGDTLLCQNGKEVIVKAGESVLVDNRVPYSLATSAASRNLVYHIPFDWMNLWAATTDDFSARVIGPSVPWGNVVKVMGTELASAIGDVNYGRAHLYAEQLASAIALSLTEGRAQQDITSASAIYRRAMDAMRSHSHVTGFGAQALATHLGISARYICKIFAFQGTTFGGELLAIRLERARSMLGNANLASVTIAEVGWRAGFSDPSHFSRVFREKYGKPPGAFRDARKIARHDA